MNRVFTRKRAFIYSCILSLLLPQTVLCDVSKNASLPRPLRLPPSVYWDGNDGTWSSFAIQIGTPPQTVRLLPSTSGNSIWPVLTVGCAASDGSNCADSRGGVFDLNRSATWQDLGLYGLPLNPEHYLPYKGNSDVGFDNITLDWPGRGGISLPHQVINGFVTTDFYIGSLGLSPQSININSPSDQFLGFLSSLSKQNLIPSLSWSYLAGASYYSYPLSGFGSLTFGGYDSTRLDVENNLTLAGGFDQFRPILLRLEKITSGSHTLLSEPIIAALDSLVSQIWLPVSVCRAFESTFGLVWNDKYQLYLLDDAQRSALLARNASITFTLSSGASNATDRLNITLPYAAFDLLAKPPLAGNQTVRYFPLKQAADESQYTIGRTFLQEVYVIADYGRGAITLYPAVYPDGSVQPDLKTICPPNSTGCIDPRWDHSFPSSPHSKTLTTGAVVGVVIGALGLLALVVLAVFLYLRHKRRKAKPPELPDSSAIKPDEDSKGAVEIEAPKLTAELEAATLDPRAELEGRYPGPLEAEAREIYEMSAEGRDAGTVPRLSGDDRHG